MRTKKYIGNNEKFADLCNYFLFDGKQVIQPDVHYAMVVRNMVQDSLNYAAQVEALAKMHRKEKDLRGDEFLSGFSREDYLVPVVTIVLYWKAGAWNGPRSLHEMFCVKDKEILKFVPDYRMNLIVPEEITDFSKFATQLGAVLEYCQCSGDKERMKHLKETRKKDGFFLDRESVEVLNECVNAGIKLPEQEGEIDMCKAMEGLIADGRAEGRLEGRLEGEQLGRARGEARMGKLVQILLSQNKIEEVMKVTTDEKVREEYYTLYRI